MSMSKMELRILRDVLEESRARYDYLSRATMVADSAEREVYATKAEVCTTALAQFNGQIRNEEPVNVDKLTKVKVNG